MIHKDPPTTSVTISTPNARASALLVLSGAEVRWRKKTRCTPICAIASATSAMTMPGPQIKSVRTMKKEAAVSAAASTRPAL